MKENLCTHIALYLDEHYRKGKQYFFSLAPEPKHLLFTRFFVSRAGVVVAVVVLAVVVKCWWL